MKRVLSICAVLMMFACTEGIDEVKSPMQNGMPTIEVGFEQEDTRIQLNQSLQTVWNRGDEVSVFYNNTVNQKYKYNGDDGARLGMLEYVSGDTGAAATLSDIVVVYPYSESVIANAYEYIHSVQVPVATTQSYVAGSYGEGGNVMIAKSTNGNIMLKNVYSWIEVKLKGNGERVRTITFKGNDGEYISGGQIYINPETAIISDAMDSEHTSTTVTLDMGDGVVLTSTPTSFYIGIAPMRYGDYSLATTSFNRGFTVVVNCDGYKPMELTTSAPITLSRNTIQPMSAVTFTRESTLVLPEDSEPANLTFKHRVLMVDHTGVGCSNCPRVMDGLKALAERTDWDEYYNLVTCHGGGFATGTYTDNAYSEAAAEIDGYYKPSGYPWIKFNYKGGNGSSGDVDTFVADNSDTLEQLVNKGGADVGISIATDVVSSAVNVLVGVKAKVADEYNITAWLLESDIYNPTQINATEDYHFISDHALRAIAGTKEYNSRGVLTRFWDSVGTIGEGEVKTHSFTIPLESGWQTSNMDVLIIVSDATDVVNTALCKVGSTRAYEYTIVEVEEPKPATVTLTASKSTVKADGSDAVTFSVTTENIANPSEVKIVNVATGNTVGTTFSTTVVGEYKFQAVWGDVKSNIVTITATSTKQYSVGDLYNENGVEGVIFAIKEDNNGATWCYLFSMDEEDLQWSTENVYCNCNSAKGIWNTYDPFDPVYSRADGGVRDINNYPAFKWCMEHGDGWFLPSYTELNWMWDAITNGERDFNVPSVAAFNKVLTDHGGTAISQDYYWSSNEEYAATATLVAFMEDSIVCLDPQKTNSYRVRAAYRFQL